jgi:hypothetical protein
MIEVIEITGYDWTPFFIFVVIAFLIIMGIGIAAAVDESDAGMMIGAFFIWLAIAVVCLFINLFSEQGHREAEQKLKLTELGYSNVEETEGYNQYSASDEDGDYVRLVLAHQPDRDYTYWVLQIKE